MRRPLALALAGLAAVVVGIAAAAPAKPEARAAALVARITLPGGTIVSSEEVVAPPADVSSGPYAYPEDGSVVAVGGSSSTVAAQPGTSSSAEAAADALVVSLFAGEVTAESVRTRAAAAAGIAGANADASASSVTSLVVLGQEVTPSPNAQLPLADWGTLEILGDSTETRGGDERRGEATVVGLRIRLVADHGGLPAGAVVEIAVAEALAAAAPGAATSPPARPAPKPPNPPPAPPPLLGPREPGQSTAGAPPELVRPGPEVTSRLTQAGYVFPVFGPASFGDAFGAPRADVPGGWHHGEDIVAPLGTPLLAVADGTVFSVGWNEIGGWRLWLRDTAGNEFYYAHLSAYSPLAVDGTRVRAGDVLGFMGNTGDAEGGTVHLHFEIHPAALLPLRYAGAVAPYPFLVAWRRAEDVSFATGRRYVPGAGARGLAPPAGAILLEVDDISRTSGLVPGALRRAVTVRRVDVERLVPRGS